ncbi:hypothetical protein [Aureispira anguillae]|uniref:Uncharacterized protein n=1 Tax=Aureispira anguillae TaxID=2864201 RepID=A0A916DTL8_9BACT|nr:hypothetical protein [Aureispira anguillae]BDS12651.1 hypothetical protein AsAng_0033750 [Aureispira anguillae]
MNKKNYYLSILFWGIIVFLVIYIQRPQNYPNKILSLSVKRSRYQLEGIYQPKDSYQKLYILGNGEYTTHEQQGQWELIETAEQQLILLNPYSPYSTSTTFQVTPYGLQNIKSLEQYFKLGY